MRTETTYPASSYETTSKLTRTVQDHPDEAVLSAFVAGAVIGLMIGGAIAGSSSGGTGRHRRVAEGLGERLMDSIENVLPSSLAKTFGVK
jgi:hypothetical protein